MLPVRAEERNTRGRDNGAGPECTQVEKPLIDQLTDMGWTHLEGAPPGTPAANDPAKSARTSFSQIFLGERLKTQLRVINRGPDRKPWLDDRRIGQAVGALTRVAAPSLLEANQKATELLLTGLTIDGLPGWDGGRDQRIRYIDWENPLRNDFIVISQFRVDVPGTQGRRCIVPDEVLFVNGVPLALVECKKPGSALSEAVKQDLRYSDRRGAQPQEGSAKLFHTMQLLVATSGDKAALGSITSGPQHYAPWRDVMEAEALISAKAKNMLRHYVETVLPNGFKAQVAAHSRRAALRYRAVFVKARDELITQIENLPVATRNADPETITNRRTKFLKKVSVKWHYSSKRPPRYRARNRSAAV